MRGSLLTPGHWPHARQLAQTVSPGRRAQLGWNAFICLCVSAPSPACSSASTQASPGGGSWRGPQDSGPPRFPPCSEQVRSAGGRECGHPSGRGPSGVSRAPPQRPAPARPQTRLLPGLSPSAGPRELPPLPVPSSQNQCRGWGLGACPPADPLLITQGRWRCPRSGCGLWACGAGGALHWGLSPRKAWPWGQPRLLPAPGSRAGPPHAVHLAHSGFFPGPPLCPAGGNPCL